MVKAINELRYHAKKRHLSLKEEGATTTLTQAKHLIARQVGFASWQDASQILKGSSMSPNCTLWHHHACDAHMNHWFAEYVEAKRFIRSDPALVLFPYKHQFVVGDEHYIYSLGLSNYSELIYQQCQRDLVCSYRSTSWDELAAYCIRQKITNH
ncbi:hypothetical protein [Aestuariibacter sp. A3R04]|uniref:hypothetical protein n=1 Tax=Aestuariibacter sp. A3R04 TaxID=2841571 RepID=UPI001C09BCB1|nr:hypothetical protein [Aestuariibacter sp. A3R04]MBU3020537.1 hypothetical protein [Aestuariibacter sp. A3R04]